MSPASPLNWSPATPLSPNLPLGSPSIIGDPRHKSLHEINHWWQHNQIQGRTSILFAYALGKAQRLLAGVDETIGPILIHGAVNRFVDAYRHAGIAQPTTYYADSEAVRHHRGQALVIAPPSAAGSAGLATQIWPSIASICLGLDANSRCASPPCRGSWLRPL